jgi:poly(3-hydroxybutyrate) depolymerase
MLQRAVAGYTSATELANRLMTEGGQDFRAAHHAVGTMVREGIELNEMLQEVAQTEVDEGRQTISIEGLDPVSVARKSNYGGGAGKESMNKCVEELKQAWQAAMRMKCEQAQKWKAADSALDEAVLNLYMAEEAQNQNGNTRGGSPKPAAYSGGGKPI